MADKTDILIDLIKEVKDSTDTRLDSIDNNLREHMRRTDVLEHLHIDNQTRIASLEEPRIALKYVKNTVILLATVSGAILTILKLTGKV